MKKVMMVSSSGGHWVQLNLMNSVLSDYERIYVTTESKYRTAVGGCKFLLIPDASRWNKIKVIWLALVMFKHMLKIRPDVVISTGAAPGFFALFFGKCLKAKTIWLDSIANVDEISMSGKQVRKYADLWLTQWEHLAKPDGPYFLGSLL